MNAFVGMDLVEVRRVAHSLQHNADQLQSAVAATDRMLLRLAQIWVGRDSVTMLSEWQHTLRPAALRAVTEVSGLSRSLTGNADDQERASAGAGGVSSANVDRGYPRTGTYGHARDLLDLCDASSYDKQKGGFDDDRIPDGWRRLSPSDLRKLGVDPDLFGSYGSAFSASIYDNGDGGYVVAFEGTDPGNGTDWAENVAGGTYATPSDLQAIKVARALDEQIRRTGGALEFTGHSAGGREATLAGLATGRSVTAYNPAPASNAEIGYARLLRGMWTPDPDVVNYVNVNDPLTLGTSALRGPGGAISSPVGRYEVLVPTGEWYQGHEISELRSGLDARAEGGQNGY